MRAICFRGRISLVALTLLATTTLFASSFSGQFSTTHECRLHSSFQR